MITCVSFIILKSLKSSLALCRQLQTPKYTHCTINEQFSIEVYKISVPKVLLKSFICSMGPSVRFLDGSHPHKRFSGHALCS